LLPGIAHTVRSTAMTHSLYAGVGQREITRTASGRNVRDPLYAKVIVFDDGATRLALITMDVVAIGGICDISDDFLPTLRQRLEEKEIGILPGRVIVNASHTHPPGRIVCDEDELVARVVAAVCDAVGSLIPVTVGTGSTRAPGLSMNRNLRLADGRLWTIRHTNPSPTEEAIEGLRPNDPEVGILRVNRNDGTPLAILYHFACHLLFGNPQGDITANFAGIASGLIEEVAGREVTAFFLQGCAGDIIDTTFKDLRRWRDIEPLGQRLGLAVLRELPRITAGPGPLRHVTRTVELPRRTDFAPRTRALEAEQRELLASLRFTTLNFESFLPLYLQHRLNPRHPSADAYSYLNAEAEGSDLPRAMDRFTGELVNSYLKNLRTMERLTHLQDDLATIARHEAINREAGGNTASAELHALQIGDFVLLTAPIEILSEVGQNIKKRSPHPHTFVSGFTNGYLHYGPPASDYPSGSYEVTECFLAPEWQAIFETEAAGMLRKLG